MAEDKQALVQQYLQAREELLEATTHRSPSLRPVVPSTDTPIRGGEEIPEFAVDRKAGIVYAVWMDAARVEQKPDHLR